MGHRVNSARVCRPRTTGQLSPEFTRPLVDLRFGYSLGYLSGQGCPLNAEMQIAQKSQKNLSTRLGNEMWEVVGVPPSPNSTWTASIFYFWPAVFTPRCRDFGYE